MKIFVRSRQSQAFIESKTKTKILYDILFVGKSVVLHLCEGPDKDSLPIG